MALSLGGERQPNQVTVDNFHRLAEQLGFGAEWTADVVGETVASLRSAWHRGVRAEERSRFTALADHYTKRLDTLPIAAGA